MYIKALPKCFIRSPYIHSNIAWTTIIQEEEEEGQEENTQQPQTSNNRSFVHLKKQEREWKNMGNQKKIGTIKVLVAIE